MYAARYPLKGQRHLIASERTNVSIMKRVLKTSLNTLYCF
jgi:hypothetical protein